MQPNQTERLAELVEMSPEHGPAARVQFLDDACGNDPELRAKVESLLSYAKHASDLIEAPAYEQAAEVLLEATGKLVPGRLLENYRIVSLLGEDGMGEDIALGPESGHQTDQGCVW